MRNRRRQLFISILRMTLIAVLAAGATIFVLYQVALRGQQRRLSETVAGIQAIAKGNILQQQNLQSDQEGPPTPETIEKAKQETLKTLRATYPRLVTIGESTGLVVVKREGDQIVFLNDYGKGDVPKSIPFPDDSSDLGQALARSLEEQSGTYQGPDFRGDQVLAAYAPIPAFGWGIVVTVNLAEVYEPFVSAALLAAAAGVAVVLFGAAFLGISTPLISKLEEAEIQARDIIDHASDGILTIDASGRILSFNAAAERIFQYPASEVLGENVAMLLPAPAAGEDAPQPLEELFDQVKQGIGYEIREIEGCRRDGTRFPMSIGLSAVKVDGRTTYSAIIRDISQQKQVEQALRDYASALEKSNQALAESQRQAEAATQAKSEFLANVSHEIRTPINAILGMTELALQNRTRKVDDYLTTVKASGESLLRLINDVLDFSKIEAHKLELEEVPFSLHELVGELLRVMAVPAEQKGLEVLCQLDPQVPDRVEGDPGRLRQVLINLLDNAIKFTEGGEVALHVSRASQEDGSPEEQTLLKFSIGDSGIGIPAEKQASIFAAFTQADGSTTRKYGGTGLGLTIAAQLVELMGGVIWLESEPGEGATFHFTARFKDVDRGEEADHGLTPDFCAGRKVLVIDDHAAGRDILAETLRGWGAEVSTSASGLDGLEQIEAAEQPFEVVLIDAQMPEMDGIEFLRHLQKAGEPPLPRAVLMQPAQPGEPQPLPLEDVIEMNKPVLPMHLARAMARALGLPAAAAELPPAAQELKSSRPLMILLAEDNAINQRVAAEWLRQWGHHVLLASDGQEALDFLAREPIDLVLMDVQMPEIDGLSATQKIRSQEAPGEHLPIVAMTAHSLHGDRDRCLEAGMDDYIAKPINHVKLFEIVERLGGNALSDSAVRRLPADALTPPTAAAAESHDPELRLDRDTVLARCGGNEAVLRDIVELLLNEAPPLMQRMQTAISEENADELETSAHTFKGAVSYFSLPALSQSAVVLEELGRQANFQQAETTLGALKEHWNRLAPALREWREVPSESPGQVGPAR